MQPTIASPESGICLGVSFGTLQSLNAQTSVSVAFGTPILCHEYRIAPAGGYVIVTGVTGCLDARLPLCTIFEAWKGYVMPGRRKVK